MTSTITIHKLDSQGLEVFHYEGELLERSETQAIVRAIYNHKDQEIFGLKLNQGDVFIEFHFTDRWYNIFAILAEDTRQIKGWYCNVTRPARIEEAHIYADDLALDVIIDPAGAFKLVDKREFDELDLSSEDRKQALEAVADLRRLASCAAGPFEHAKRFMRKPKTPG
jgi:protein associated with RNAse G/E